MRTNIFNDEEFIFFTTRDYALNEGLSVSAASKQLKRLMQKGLIVFVTRGIWANSSHPYFSPMGNAPYLLRAEQGYVSFLTALHRHGVLSQIPSTIQIASTGHTRTQKTPIGTFEFFQIKPEIMSDGIGWAESRLPYRIACPEKALLDTLYITTRKGKRFASIPELDIHESSFEHEKYKKLLASLRVPISIVNAIKARSQDLGIL